MMEQTYIGIDQDPEGAMNATGRTIRDAWIFGLIPEDETCAGWSASRINALHQQVNQEWDKYGLLASNLPPDLRERHKRIYDEAIATARAQGWNPDMDDD